MSETTRDVETFVTAYASGKVEADAIDDWVDLWHDADEDSPLAALELHEYLGLGRDEYQEWVHAQSSLPRILSRRHVLHVVSAPGKAPVLISASRFSKESVSLGRSFLWDSSRVSPGFVLDVRRGHSGMKRPSLRGGRVPEGA